jgi:signal transduction histidine kinase
MRSTSTSLSRALMQAILLSSGAVLLITSSMFFVYDLISFRQNGMRQLAALAEAVAINSSAALAFRNPDDAAQVLAALRADQSVQAAALYDSHGALFTAYPADLDPALLPTAVGEPGFRYEGLSIVGFQPVIEGSRRLGTLYVRSNLSAIYRHASRYSLIVLVVAVLAGLAAYQISRRLRARLMQPIRVLQQTASSVSERYDYSVRAPSTGTAEFEPLTEAFNHMLQQIGIAERKLQTQLGRLGLLQHITRAIGDRQDMPSVFEVVLANLEHDLPVDFAAVLTQDASARHLSVSRVGPASSKVACMPGLVEGAVVMDTTGPMAHSLMGDLVYRPDVREIPLPFMRHLSEGGFTSVVLAPLMFESDVYGVLVAARRDKDAFSSGECEFLHRLAEHVALAIRQATLYGALQQAYDELRQSQLTMLQQERLRALGQMASGIAHDINNAISPVSLYTEALLRHEPNLSERARGYLAIIQQAVQDVADTVARMRAFYREREVQHTLDRVDVNRVITQVIELTRPRWSDQPQSQGIAIELKTELAADLPEFTAAGNELRDALTNLIFNAVDAMPQGGVLTLRSRALVVPQGTSVVIEVIDTGVGMDEDTRRRCLEPFFTTKGERGTGLGLAMVYGMVQRHSAALEIDSAPGKGTTMRLIFTAIGPSADATARIGALPAPPRPLRILLVDDDPLLLNSLRDTLQQDGHLITAAAGGQAGVDTFNQVHRTGGGFDVVITDLGMPYVDGRKVASSVKALSPGTPVVLLTGWGQRMIASNDKPAFVDRVLSKPPRLHELRATFAELAP